MLFVIVFIIIKDVIKDVIYSALARSDVEMGLIKLGIFLELGLEKSRRIPSAF